MPPPKSPLDKPSSSHSRRPGPSRRSSSEKSTKSSKHGIKSGSSSQSKDKDSMTDATSGATAPSKPLTAGKDLARSQDLGTADIQEPRSPIVGGVAGTRQLDAGNLVKEDHGSEESAEENNTKGRDADEVERLRLAMDAQLQLSQQREKLTRHLLDKDGKVDSPINTGLGRSRVSPINEERASPSLEEAFASPIPTALGTASTESAKTIRGGITPAANIPRTPSYPFPSMRPARQLSWGAHRPFTALSPTVNPANFADGSFHGVNRDRMLSGSVTPASTLNFRPPSEPESQVDPIFEAPNLYDLSLMLASEPGLDAWWTTVVQVMRELYKAERVTLSVPADSTDIENVPWGQKATFNAVEEDELSMAYMKRGSSLIPGSGGTNDTSTSEEQTTDDAGSMSFPTQSSVRPAPVSRHSFTSYEDTKKGSLSTSDSARNPIPRPRPVTRAKSYFPTGSGVPPRSGTLQSNELNIQTVRDQITIENTSTSVSWENAETATREVRGRIFSVLQALDIEADPLIDSGGVLRVMERGRVIALTRDYPYVEEETRDETSGGSGKSAKVKENSTDKTKKGKSPETDTRFSNLLGSSRRPSRITRGISSEKGKSLPASASRHSHEDEPQSLTPRYEEYEQTPASPWAQSPAPSPAVRTETAENPFFSKAPVDEETFNPEPTPQDYSQMPPVEAIGVDRSWTVLHIPLIHPLLSKPVESFRLDAAAMELKTARTKTTSTSRRSSETGKQQGTDAATEKRTPIAIISILSPVIPYPSALRHSLSHLAPHLATSFSLCRHYSNLETEVAGLSRKRPQTTGFGAVAPGGRQAPDRNPAANFSYSYMEDSGTYRSTGGSITSPSDYSGVSRSTAGSPTGTPGWGPSSIGFSRDKRSSGGSPSYSNAGESYFNSRAKLNAGRVSFGSASGNTNARLTSTNSFTTEGRPQHEQNHEKLFDSDDFEKVQSDESQKSSPEQFETFSSISTPKHDQRSRQERLSKDANTNSIEARDVSPSRKHQDAFSPRRQAMRTASNQGAAKTEKQHTQLHSYGADYGATFQSLPTTNAPATKYAPTEKVHGRSASISTPTDAPQHMLPPSDRLKGLMLESLPAHVFVALPATGEIVWVNNRYLTYRGQTVPELYQDPWGSIHPEERDDYLKSWSHAIRTGEQFSMQVRIRRFDGTYRWFYTRAVGHRDIRGVIVQWYGSHMDIHDQHIAEVKAARQEEIEASEAKHRQLANLIPQIIFAATEDEGVTFANEQWLSYTGQDFESSLGLGFMDFVHPDDLAKCHMPTDIGSPAQSIRAKKAPEPSRNPSQSSSAGQSSNKSSNVSETPTEATVKDSQETLSRNNSSSGGSFYDLPAPDFSELAKNGLIKASTDSNGRLSYTTEVRLRSKTGEYRWHLVRCVEVDNISLGSGDGSWFGACTDINDHKLLETKLKEAMDSKTRFLSNMSHEIRTPLIGISGMVNFLQDTTLNDEQMDYANTIHASAKSLLNIINDILDLSKVDAGMMKLSYDWFHPRSLVEEVNEMVCTMAITKRLELNYVVDNDVPEMVKGDKFRIRQILLNVIGNAIKFTNAGEVFSRCKVIAGGTEGISNEEIMLEFSVVDSGRGFTAEEAEMIFKPFSQIDGSSTRQVGGSGLGLVISRNLVELHGGHMTGSAIPGKGSTFVFSAKFGLPTDGDYPDPPTTPHVNRVASMHESDVTEGNVARAMKQAGGNPMLANKFMQTPLESPVLPSTAASPAVLSSSGSEPSLRSTYSHATQRSSDSSIAKSLAHFGEAARATASDLSLMKLALPDKVGSPPTSSTLTRAPTLPPPSPIATTSLSYVANQVSGGSVTPSDAKRFRPSMYSILLICPQNHSREATTQHIENTLPKDVPHKIIPIASVPEAQKLISGDESVIFTHIVLNLSEAEDIVSLVEQINTSKILSHASIVVLSDPVQRQEVIKMAAAYDYDQLAKDNRITFIYKPVKPSRFAVVFDPDKERDLSTDRNRFSAQQQVASQKQNYLDVAKRLGNKGHKVLLVEDNLINQKVLIKYLGKIGVSVDLAMDGVECIEKVFPQPHSFYSLILCDLHMPRKDGYETCREIRQWEKKEKHSPMPIIALSANVMIEVVDKCVQAGFSNYITKPIDFKSLSTAMGEFLDPIQPQSHTSAMKR